MQYELVTGTTAVYPYAVNVKDKDSHMIQLTGNDLPAFLKQPTELDGLDKLPNKLKTEYGVTFSCMYFNAVSLKELEIRLIEHACNNFGIRNDAAVKEIWGELGSIPVTADDDLEESFRIWEKGTDKFEVWHWFDKYYSKGTAVLMGVADVSGGAE